MTDDSVRTGVLTTDSVEGELALWAVTHLQAIPEECGRVMGAILFLMTEQGVATKAFGDLVAASMAVAVAVEHGVELAKAAAEAKGAVKQ